MFSPRLVSLYLSSSIIRILSTLFLSTLYLIPSTAIDSVEDQLTKSLLNCPLCAGKEPCLASCRAGNRSWKDCLSECLADNPPMQSMFISLAEKMHNREKQSQASRSESSQSISAGVDGKSGVNMGGVKVGEEEEEDDDSGSEDHDNSRREKKDVSSSEGYVGGNEVSETKSVISGSIVQRNSSFLAGTEKLRSFGKEVYS